jgi:hypothetical protein
VKLTRTKNGPVKTTVDPPLLDSADRLDAVVVLGVLLIDVLLLALVEMMFVTLRIGSVPCPVSSLIALVSTPWLVRRTGDLPFGAPAAAVVLALWMGVMTLLGFSGPGGDVLLPDTWPSWLLLVAGSIPGALALGRIIRARHVLRRSGRRPGRLG